MNVVRFLAIVAVLPAIAYAQLDDDEFSLPKDYFETRAECQRALAELRRIARDANSGLSCEESAQGWAIRYNPN